MAQSFSEWKIRNAMMIDWGALVRTYQDYFDFKNAEIARLKERVIVFEKRLSECEILVRGAWQESQMNALDKGGRT